LRSLLGRDGCLLFCGYFSEIGLGVAEVVAGVHADGFQSSVVERAGDFAGDADYERAWWDDGALGDDGSGGDDGASADAGSVEDDGADADEDVVFHDAAVDGGVVADGDSVADEDGVAIFHAVEHGAVLDVGAGADADLVDVAAEDGVHPDGGVLAEDDVADDLGGDVDVGGGRDGWKQAAERTDHASSVIGREVGNVGKQTFERVF